jgi:hypothetical protein
MFDTRSRRRDKDRREKKLCMSRLSQGHQRRSATRRRRRRSRRARRV